VDVDILVKFSKTYCVVLWLLRVWWSK